ncbi:MAG: hypothetical protein J1E98_00090 [Lachnospiraceae bacterium]|nr:hypothetical protein [Lachnospiraceae bacterium]
MKKKQSQPITDEMLYQMGVYFPPGTPASESFSRKTDFLEGNRIISLKRESTYEAMLPKLNMHSFLNLSFPMIDYYSASHYYNIIKIIGKYIQSKLCKIKNEGSLADQGILFLSELSGVYKDKLSFSFPDPKVHSGAEIASATLKTSHILRVEVKGSEKIEVYGGIGSISKRKPGFYYMRNNPNYSVEIVNISFFLALISVCSCLHSIISEDISPLITNIFSRQLDELNANIHKYPDYAPLIQFLKDKETVPLEFLFRKFNKSEGHPQPYYFSPNYTIYYKLVHVFYQVADVFQDVQNEFHHRESLHKKIATAYITKKNIPLSIQKAMNNSAFLNYFGYVEFDEDVDLNAVSKIEEEYRAINKQYFSGLSFTDVTLRFRKLGKHKASGLYYPSIHNLCVDIQNPSSFIHEHFHMLDDQLGDLSLEVDFDAIVKAYKAAFLNEMKNLDPAVRKKLNGSSKYNLKYFFRRAEIFARCGEIYFNRILNVKSSLLEPSLTYAYPECEELNTLIEKYYEQLLNELANSTAFKQAV